MYVFICIRVRMCFQKSGRIENFNKNILLGKVGKSQVK